MTYTKAAIFPVALGRCNDTTLWILMNMNGNEGAKEQKPPPNTALAMPLFRGITDSTAHLHSFIGDGRHWQ